MTINSMWRWCGFGCALALCLASARPAAADFAKEVGDVKVGDVVPMTPNAPLKVPFLTWGGDIATFHSNGGLKTAQGSTYGRLGLNLDLTNGDDFKQQVKDYLAGKSPFLRGTYSMIGMASEVINKDKRTKGVMIMQLTWSLGDHMVGRRDFVNLNDLKGKKICLQRQGPHVGLLDEVLTSANLDWNDITPVWADDLTATKEKPNSNPAAMFRKDKSIDACFVISPDMVGLCGGLDTVGDKKKDPGQEDGSHVVVSTSYLKKTIADVYLCRHDFYDKNPDLVKKLIGGYLKGCEEVQVLYETHDNPQAPKEEKNRYELLLQMSQDIFGKEAFPTLDDVHGLLADCTFAHYNENVRFFMEGEDNTTGFARLRQKANVLVRSQEYVTAPMSAEAMFDRIEFGFSDPLFTSLKHYVKPGVKPVEPPPGPPQEGNGKVVLSFNIYFERNQAQFDGRLYEKSFFRALETANKTGGACVFRVRGYADPAGVIQDALKAGQQLGIITPNGLDANGVQLYMRGSQAFDPADTKTLIKLVTEGVFEKATDVNGMPLSPNQNYKAALIKSKERAEGVKAALLKYAERKKKQIAENQFLPSGEGIADPVVPYPKTDADQQSNMRVVFELIQFSGEKAVAPGK